jgi:hypothetical protein
MTARAEPMPSSTASQAPARPRPLAHPPPKAEAQEETKLRTVQVLISGVSGGTATIDGETVGTHGAKKDLVVGQTYVFGFVPPNEECCIRSEKRLAIPDGEGTYQVSGRITLRPATIRASGAPDGSRLSCGMWGEAATPKPLEVMLSDPEESSGSCTVIPPTLTGIPPRTVPVKIRPGRTIQLWP